MSSSLLLRAVLLIFMMFRGSNITGQKASSWVGAAALLKLRVMVLPPSSGTPGMWNVPPMASAPADAIVSSCAAAASEYMWTSQCCCGRHSSCVSLSPRWPSSMPLLTASGSNWKYFASPWSPGSCDAPAVLHTL